MLISISVFVIVIVVHELAHGIVAYRLGDPTARNAGRLTLNPFAHADLVGTVILPALLLMTHSPVVFGWAKPVPINPNNFSNPKRDMLLTALAGPAANFLLAVFFTFLFRAGIFPAHSVGWTFLLSGVIISLILGIFNLIPIPPLDGSSILVAILPPDAARSYMHFQRYGFVVLIGLLYLGLFDNVILPLVKIFIRLLMS
ncbi:MAG: site-2 protease family protein [Candidatus Omnitrophota bacterium]